MRGGRDLAGEHFQLAKYSAGAVCGELGARARRFRALCDEIPGAVLGPPSPNTEHKTYSIHSPETQQPYPPTNPILFPVYVYI